MEILALLLALPVVSPLAAAQGPAFAAPAVAIEATLDAFHAAAAQANEAAYFDLFAPSGVFLGTDATERWDKTAFQAFAHPERSRQGYRGADPRGEGRPGRRRAAPSLEDERARQAERANVSLGELEALKTIASDLLALTSTELDGLVKKDALQEICRDHQGQEDW